MAAPEEPCGGRAGWEPGREAAGLSGARGRRRQRARGAAAMFRCGEEIISGESEEESSGVNLMDFSDEILLHILSYVPCTDLVLNVRGTCRKLATLCLDKSLTHTVLLQKDYKVGTVACLFC
ncbi:F-box/LRR-repeat protein 18-like [Rhea pennata]|uniref:F-box/LRR-repeat protein 18-like n=1 Tax=Rhea pennata TaxID=8795 RepID=UPI002E2684C4